MNNENLKPDMIYDLIWLNLIKGSRERHHEYHNAVFSSVDLKQNPSIRTVIIRGADKEKKILTFHADIRSTKIKEIKKNKNCMLLFYSKQIKQQLRIKITSKLNYKNDIAKKAWGETHLMSRKCYLSTFSPGSRVNEPSDGIPNELTGIEPDVKISELGFEKFVVVENYIYSLECLNLSSQGHRRLLFNWENNKLNYQWLIP